MTGSAAPLEALLVDQPYKFGIVLGYGLQDQPFAPGDLLGKDLVGGFIRLLFSRFRLCTRSLGMIGDQDAGLLARQVFGQSVDGFPVLDVVVDHRKTGLDKVLEVLADLLLGAAGVRGRVGHDEASPAAVIQCRPENLYPYVVAVIWPRHTKGKSGVV